MLLASLTVPDTPRETIRAEIATATTRRPMAMPTISSIKVMPRWARGVLISGPGCLGAEDADEQAPHAMVFEERIVKARGRNTEMDSQCWHGRAYNVQTPARTGDGR